MIAEMLSGPVNLSGENKATCHCNPERKKTRIKDQKAPIISKKRHSYKEMTARLIINPRPLWFQQKLARVSSLRSDRSPPSLYSKCPAHIFYLMRFQSSFNIYLDCHFLSEVLQKACQAKRITCPFLLPAPGALLVQRCGFTGPILCDSHPHQPAMLGITVQPPFVHPQSLTKGLVARESVLKNIFY